MVPLDEKEMVELLLKELVDLLRKVKNVNGCDEVQITWQIKKEHAEMLLRSWDDSTD